MATVFGFQRSYTEVMKGSDGTWQVSEFLATGRKDDITHSSLKFVRQVESCPTKLQFPRFAKTQQQGDMRLLVEGAAYFSPKNLLTSVLV